MEENRYVLDAKTVLFNLFRYTQSPFIERNKFVEFRKYIRQRIDLEDLLTGVSRTALDFGRNSVVDAARAFPEIFFVQGEYIFLLDDIQNVPDFPQIDPSLEHVFREFARDYLD